MLSPSLMYQNCRLPSNQKEQACAAARSPSGASIPQLWQVTRNPNRRCSYRWKGLKQEGHRRRKHHASHRGDRGGWRTHIHRRDKDEASSAVTSMGGGLSSWRGGRFPTCPQVGTKWFLAALPPPRLPLASSRISPRRNEQKEIYGFAH